MEIKKSKLLIWPLVALCISGCIAGQSGSIETIPTEASTAVTDQNPDSIASRVEATASPVLVQTEQEPQNREPGNIALGLHFIQSCQIEPKDYISIASLAESADHIILQEADSNFRYPLWSPDGEWLSYIQSSPSLVGEITNTAPTDRGIDAVWIMRNDGSEAHQVSFDFPSERFITETACGNTSGITTRAAWSPDGKTLAFIYSNWNFESGDVEYGYYVTETESGTTKEVLSNTSGRRPFWISKDALLIQEVDNLRVINVRTLEMRSMQNAPGVDGDDFWAHLFYTTGTRVIAIFPFTVSPPPPLNQQTQLWTLDVNSGDWDELGKIEVAGIPRIQGERIAICDSRTNMISVYDLNDLEFMGAIKLPAEDPSACASFVISPSTSRAFISINNLSSIDIYVFNLVDLKTAPASIFDNFTYAWPELPWFITLSPN